MKKNIGFTDRIIRLILAVIFAGLYLTGTVTGTWGNVLVLLSTALTLTSLVSYCPFYDTADIDTCPIRNAKKIKS